MIVGAFIGAGVAHIWDSSHVVSSHTALAQKNFAEDPFFQGYAPQGGGMNADSGPGRYESPEEVQKYYPPVTKRVNPMPPCNSQPLLTLTVKKGSSVWQTLAEQFPSWSNRALMDSVNYLQGEIDRHPKLKVRDVNLVPVGYQMVVGAYDGAGPGPVE